MTRYFYLDVDLGAEQSPLSARRAVEAALDGVFGASGAAAAQVDVVRAGGRRALLRVRAQELRRLRAALALALAPRAATVRVLAQAPSLQALL